MKQISLSLNNVAKSTLHTWVADIFFALILAGCSSLICVLIKVMMEGL